MKEKFPKQPGNYELQAQYLRQLQQEISQGLFVAGVASRLLAPRGDSGLDIHGAVFSVEGLDQLDLIFTPSLSRTRHGDRTEKLLSLTAMKDEVSSNGLPSRAYAYRRVGMIDSAGVLMKFSDIAEEDAEAVYQAALRLEAARDSGELPNLDFSLLTVFNPNTAIQQRPSA